MSRILLLSVLTIVLIQSACTRADPQAFPDPITDLKTEADQTTARLVLAGGCFWCTEAVFEQVPGVTDVISGYAGGNQDDANYESVSTGKTQHAEAIQITYNPQIISFGKLLKIFFSVAHDPTQLNRQGPDVGPQYRSAIFYADDQQKHIAQAYITQLNQGKIFPRPIVTTLEPLTTFYPAEPYHQNYARQNPDQPYIAQQVPPKLKKLEKTTELTPTTCPDYSQTPSPQNDRE